MRSVTHAKLQERHERTHPSFSRDADLPLQKIHGAVGSFGRFSIEALNACQPQRATIIKAQCAYEWVVLAPLLAFFGETSSADPRHGGYKSRRVKLSPVAEAWTRWAANAEVWVDRLSQQGSEHGALKRKWEATTSGRERRWMTTRRPDKQAHLSA